MSDLADDCRQVQGAGCAFLGTAAEADPCETDSDDSASGGGLPADGGGGGDPPDAALEGGGAGYGCAVLSPLGSLAVTIVLLALARRQR